MTITAINQRDLLPIVVAITGFSLAVYMIFWLARSTRKSVPAPTLKNFIVTEVTFGLVLIFSLGLGFYKLPDPMGLTVGRLSGGAHRRSHALGCFGGAALTFTMMLSPICAVIRHRGFRKD